MLPLSKMKEELRTLNTGKLHEKSPLYCVLSFKVSSPKQKFQEAYSISVTMGINCCIIAQRKGVSRRQIIQS